MRSDEDFSFSSAATNWDYLFALNPNPPPLAPREPFKMPPDVNLRKIAMQGASRRQANGPVHQRLYEERYCRLRRAKAHSRVSMMQASSSMPVLKVQEKELYRGPRVVGMTDDLRPTAVEDLLPSRWVPRRSLRMDWDAFVNRVSQKPKPCKAQRTAKDTRIPEPIPEGSTVTSPGRDDQREHVGGEAFMTEVDSFGPCETQDPLQGMDKSAILRDLNRKGWYEPRYHPPPPKTENDEVPSMLRVSGAGLPEQGESLETYKAGAEEAIASKISVAEFKDSGVTALALNPRGLDPRRTLALYVEPRDKTLRLPSLLSVLLPDVLQHRCADRPKWAFEPRNKSVKLATFGGGAGLSFARYMESKGLA